MCSRDTGKARDMSKGSLTGVEVLEMAGGWVPERLGATVTTLAFPLSVTGNQWEALSREVLKFIHFFPSV